jgi:hypothetical protein
MITLLISPMSDEWRVPEHDHAVDYRQWVNILLKKNNLFCLSRIQY